MKIKDFITPTTITTLLVALIAIIGYKFTLEATAETVKFHTGEISALGERTGLIDNKVIKLETEIPNIKDSIGEIKGSVSEIRNDVKKLLSRAMQ